MGNDTNYVQSEAKLIGAEGCYLASIVKGAEHFLKKLGYEIKPDLLRIYEESVKQGWLEKDCYVLNPVAIMYLSLGVLPDEMKYKNFITFNKRESNYEAKENELEIGRFEAKKTCKTFAHFVEMEGSTVVYDPFGKSNTVADGELISKRVFTFDIEKLKQWFTFLEY